MLALVVCFPLTCTIVGQRFARSDLCFHYYGRIVLFTQQHHNNEYEKKPCKLDSMMMIAFIITLGEIL